MTPWDLAESVRHRWKLVLAVTLIVLALVGIWSLTSPRRYEASATLLFGGFDPSTTTEKTAAGSDVDSTSFLGTQADVVTSDFVAQQVVTALGLAEQPAMIDRWRAATNGRGSAVAWLSDGLLAGLTVLPTKNTNVLRVTYTSNDADYSATVANAFADTFIKTQLMLRVQPARIYSDWFGQRTRDVKDRLEQAQAKLTRYQREHGLVGGDRADVEMNRLTELSSQLSIAEAASADVGARAGGNVAASPEVQASGVVQGLRSAIASTTARLSQLNATFGPNYPDVVTTRAELAALQGKLGEAIGQAVQSVHVAGTAAQGREAELRRRVSEQRAHVLDLSGNQDQLAVLQRDVDTAKQAYDGVTQRLNTMRLQSEIPQADASLLDRAAPSYLPVSPNIPLRLVLGLILGAGLGITLALFMEWRRPLVRTDAGLQQVTGLPLLANLEQWPQQRRLPYSR